MKVEIGMVSGKIILQTISDENTMESLAAVLNDHATMKLYNPKRLIVCKNVEYVKVST